VSARAFRSAIRHKTQKHRVIVKCCGISETERILQQSVKRRQFSFLSVEILIPFQNILNLLESPQFAPLRGILSSKEKIKNLLLAVWPLPARFSFGSPALGDSHFGRPAFFLLHPVAFRSFLYIRRLRSLRLYRA